MNPVIKSLLWRNALVGVVSVFMLSSLHLVSNIHLPHWLLWFIPAAFFCGLLWANRLLFKHQRPIVTILLCVGLVLVLGLPVSFGSTIVGRAVVDWKYRTQGFRLVRGCNGGASVEADGQVRTLEQLISELVDSPDSNTNELAHLQAILVLAQEKARVLDEDCRWRGHRGTYPWKTNWSGIGRELKAAQERFYQ